VTLGDAFTLNAAWPAMYASYLEQDLGVRVELYQAAREAQTILGLRQQVMNNAEVRQQIAQADLITLNWCTATFELQYGLFREGKCGGADGQDCLRALSLSAQADWQVMLNELVKLRSPKEAHFVTFRTGAVLAQRTCEWGSPCWEALLAHVVAWNDFVERAAPQHGMLVVDADSPFLGAGHRGLADNRYYQEGGTLLSQEGSLLVADLLRHLGLRAKTPSPSVLLEPAPMASGTDGLSVAIPLLRR